MTGNSRVLAIVAFCTFIAACDSKSSGSTGPATTGTAAPIVSAASLGVGMSDGAAPLGSARPAGTNGTGSWAGTYTSKQAPEPAPRKTEDDGSQGVGDGTITLSVEDKTAKGTLDGALGESVLTGTSSGDTMSGTLYPKQASPTSFYGTWVLEKKDGALSGKLVASRGNAGAVREAALTLKGK